MRRSVRPHSAFTLAEIIIVSGIFLVFATISTSLLVYGFRATNLGAQQGDALEQAELTMYRLSTELRSASSVLDPGLGAVLSERGTSFLVFRTQVNGVPQTIAYRMVPDPQPQAAARTMCVQRLLYENDYSPAHPSSQHIIPGSERMLTRFPSRIVFAMGWGPEVTSMGVALAVQGTGAPPYVLRTKVVMRRHLAPGE